MTKSRLKKKVGSSRLSRQETAEAVTTNQPLVSKLSLETRKNYDSRLSLTVWLLLLIILLAGLALRMSYLQRHVFDGDEYYTMLAISQTLQEGAPILPSGLFYEKGLSYTYLAAFLTAFVGFDELMVRWPSLLAGMFGVAIIFMVGRRLFGSSAAGLLAAGALALDVNAIEWSTRARMYALAQMTLPLLFLFAWQFTEKPRPRYLLIVLAILAGTLLAHVGVAIFVPVLGLTILTSLRLREELGQIRHALATPVLTTLAGVILLTGLLIVSSNALNLHPEINPDDEAGLTTAFQRDPQALMDKVRNYLTDNQRAPLAWLAMLAIIWTFYRMGWNNIVTIRERSIFFVSVSVLLTMTVLLMLPAIFTRDRTIFLFLLPQMYLLSGAGLQLVISTVQQNLSPQSTRWLNLQTPLAIGLALGGMVWFVRPTIDYIQQAPAAIRYDLAYPYVQANRQAGDIVVGPNMAACYLYLEQCDYYLQEMAANSTNQFTGGDTDWYVGAPWLGQETEFNHLLAQHNRVWLVVQEDNLRRGFSPAFSQQIGAQMELVYHPGDVLIFRSQTQPVPLPNHPDQLREWQWQSGLKLSGYNTTWLDDQHLVLTLFWEAVPSWDDFNDLRLQLTGQPTTEESPVTIDYLPLENMPEILQRQAWDEAGQIRDQLRLTFPEAITDDFSLKLTIYDTQSRETLPLRQNESGNHQVELTILAAQSASQNEATQHK